MKGGRGSREQEEVGVGAGVEGRDEEERDGKRESIGGGGPQQDGRNEAY